MLLLAGGGRDVAGVQEAAYVLDPPGQQLLARELAGGEDGALAALPAILSLVAGRLGQAGGAEGAMAVLAHFLPSVSQSPVSQCIAHFLPSVSQSPVSQCIAYFLSSVHASQSINHQLVNHQLAYCHQSMCHQSVNHQLVNHQFVNVSYTFCHQPMCLQSLYTLPSVHVSPVSQSLHTFHH